MTAAQPPTAINNAPQLGSNVVSREKKAGSQFSITPHIVPPTGTVGPISRPPGAGGEHRPQNFTQGTTSQICIRESAPPFLKGAAAVHHGKTHDEIISVLRKNLSRELRTTP